MTAAQKSMQAFRTISEAANELDVPQHVLRFWETKFSQIKPMKRGGGRRYYRPEDIDLLKGIRKLLYEDGFTIKGVQKVLREHGVRFVMDAGAFAARGDGVAAQIAAPSLVQKGPETPNNTSAGVTGDARAQTAGTKTGTDGVSMDADIGFSTQPDRPDTGLIQKAGTADGAQAKAQTRAQVGAHAGYESGADDLAQVAGPARADAGAIPSSNARETAPGNETDSEPESEPQSRSETSGGAEGAGPADPAPTGPTAQTPPDGRTEGTSPPDVPDTPHAPGTSVTAGARPADEAVAQAAAPDHSEPDHSGPVHSGPVDPDSEPDLGPDRAASTSAPDPVIDRASLTRTTISVHRFMADVPSLDSVAAANVQFISDQSVPVAVVGAGPETAAGEGADDGAANASSPEPAQTLENASDVIPRHAVSEAQRQRLEEILTKLEQLKDEIDRTLRSLARDGEHAAQSGAAMGPPAPDRALWQMKSSNDDQDTTTGGNRDLAVEDGALDDVASSR